MQQEADPSTQPDQPPDSIFNINRIGIRVPPFWSEKPDVLFAQLDGQFALSNITQDETNFYYVISQLDSKYAAVKGVIMNFPLTCRYDRIKAELIRCLSISQEQWVRQLLMHDEMGDRRPIHFFRHLRTLADPSAPSDFLRTLWTNRPPPNIQAIIATQAQVALDDVAQLAVKTAEVTPPPCVARASSSGDEIGTLTTHIDKQARQVTALSASPSRPCSPSQTRQQARRA
jgi:hypothetical protein